MPVWTELPDTLVIPVVFFTVDCISGKLPQETGNIEEALRLAAALLGFDKPPIVVFVDDGIRCLLPGALQDPTLNDYLQAVADMAGLEVLSKSIEAAGYTVHDLEDRLGANTVSVEEMANMIGECKSVVAF